MKTFLGILSIPVFIAICGFALIANESAAKAGQYEQADQFLYSVMSR